MARATGPTKSDLQETIDAAVEVLEEAYDPESTREELAAAAGKALDILNGEDDDHDDEDDDEEDDDAGE